MTATEFKVNDKDISYDVKENGYDIYLGGSIWITQYTFFPNKIINEDGTIDYEKSCIAHIEDIIEGFKKSEEAMANTIE